MPLGAARIALLAKTQVVAVAEVIRKKVGVSAYGNAQIDTAQYQFGGSSALFDGTGDYLDCNQPIIPSDSDFTIECWVRTPSIPISDNYYVISQFSASGEGRNGLGLNQSLGKFRYVANGSNQVLLDSTTSYAANTWYHLAVVRNGNDYTLYVDGTSEATDNSSMSLDQTVNCFVGSRNGTDDYHNGHIDEVRISNTARYTSGFTPSTTPFVNDDDTLLLMHMDGTDGSTHFEDDNGVGRSAVGLSAIGNAQIDTGDSKFGGSSALFDGTGDYLLAKPISAMDWGTGDFTVETWIRFNTTSNSEVFLSGSDSGSLLIQKNASNTIRIGRAGIAWDNTTSTVTLNTGTWYHIAVSRSSGNMQIFVDGTSYFSGSNTNNYKLSGNFYIGGTPTSGQEVDGHMDEVRVSNIARYTTGFTPSTTPFVNDTDTQFLAHMDGTDGSTLFLDDNGAEITKGGVQFERASTEYINVTSLGNLPADNQHYHGSFWIKLDSQPAEGELFVVSAYSNTSDGNLPYYFAYRLQSGVYKIQLSGHYRIGASTYIVNLDSALTTGQWHHFIFKQSLSSTDKELWLDGVQIDTTAGPGISDKFPMDNTQGRGSMEQFTLGAYTVNNSSFGFPWDGCIAQHYWKAGDVDISTNIAKFYDGGYVNMGSDGTGSGLGTPDFFFDGQNQSEFAQIRGSVTGTVTVGGTLDACKDTGRSRVGVTANGDAQIDTAQSKFGGTSFLGDGTGDYLKVTNDGQFDFGTGDFTIEWFQYLTSLDRFAIDMRGGTNGSNILIYSYPTDGSATDLYLYVNSANRISASGVISANVWQHIAVSRSGTSTKLFVDGTQVGSTYTDSTNYDNADLLIWENQLSAGNYTPPGHIDEFRISNTARYTANFTPTTESFQNDANTLLLLHMDGTDGGTDFVDDNGKESA